MKVFILILLTAVLFVGCKKEEINQVVEKRVIYDSQDNVIFYEGKWLENWDYQNNTIANDKLGFRIYPDNDKIVLIDKTWLNIRSIYSGNCNKLEFIKSGNNYEITFPNMQGYMLEDDVFYFLLIIDE